jgi:hypothetical protein
MRTELYRHFDADGRLLYVGISLSTIARFDAHRTRSHWSSKVATITIERFETRNEAFAAEAAAILAESPLHNLAGKPSRYPEWSGTEEEDRAEMAKMERLLARDRAEQIAARL